MALRPDDGPFDAMNTGLEAALRLGTSHVLFLNAGDRLAGPGTAGLLRRAAFDRPEAALLYGDALETGWDGRPVLKRARSHRTAPYGMFTHHQAMLYRCDALAGLRYDGRYRVAADYDLTLRLLRTGASAVRLPFSVCRFASGGLSQRSPALGRSEQSRIRRDVLNHGLWFSYAINGVQWLAGSVRRQFPRAYAKWRYRDAETVGLSDSLHPD
ncbi:colanic acid biosynthesis glycosyl transferase [Azospirillum thermophilum]|uniref:colanic acid biosynthesis glycosyl transferase n=1 Tax=Azospirillum thermophilum TaxID=2202148 RepID=UPI001FE42857|nr:colanic acid biosynthesis glycosyl transferase [Azospirillum thermophilum]